MTRREILDTEQMLQRLTRVLIDHAPPGAAADGYGGTARLDAAADGYGGTARLDAESLRPKRIGGVLHYIVAEQSGYPYFVNHSGAKVTYTKIPDREKGALARLARIMARYPSLRSYVQTDPRGCALYILRPGDVPAGEDVSAYYSRGVAVHQ